MAQPPTTFGASVGLGEESTWGTAVSRTNWLEIISCSLERAVDYDQEPTLGRDGDLGRMKRRKHVNKDEAGGDIEWVMAYDDSTLMMFKHAMGGLSTSGAGPYNHDFTLGDLPTGLTIEFLKDPHDTDTAEVFEGCKISQLVISGGAEGLVTCKATIIAETSGGYASGGAPTYTSGGNAVKEWHLAANSLQWNGLNATCVKSFEITLDNAIDRRHVMSSKLTKEPAPSGFRSVTMKATIEFESNTFHSRYLDGTEGDLEMAFTSGSLEANLELHNAYLSEYTAPASGPGPYEVSVTWTAQSDGTDLGFYINMVNSNASATAN